MKTTKKHFSIFKQEFLKQVDRLGLNEWRITFANELDDDNYATILCNLHGRTALIRLTKQWDDRIPLCEKEVRQRAKHEAAELLVADAEMLAGSRHVSTDELEVAFHTLVRRIERLL